MADLAEWVQYAETCKYVDWTDLKIQLIRATTHVWAASIEFFLFGAGFGFFYLVSIWLVVRRDDPRE